MSTIKHHENRVSLQKRTKQWKQQGHELTPLLCTFPHLCRFWDRLEYQFHTHAIKINEQHKFTSITGLCIQIQRNRFCKQKRTTFCKMILSHAQQKDSTYLTTCCTCSNQSKLAIFSYQSVGSMCCETYTWKVHTFSFIISSSDYLMS
jgi:hypothetical protein